MKYRFYLKIDDGSQMEVNPIYKEDLALEYELETGQKFYRSKLSGKLTFVGADYARIIAQEVTSCFYIEIQNSTDGQTYSTYWNGLFYMTDCEVDEDTKTIIVQPSTNDEYTKILANLDKEYDIIKLSPEIEKLIYLKRPIIQYYALGDSMLTNLLGNMVWNSDCTAVDDMDDIVSDHHFSLDTIAQSIVIEYSALTAGIEGTYSGKVPSPDAAEWVCNLYDDSNDYYYVRITKSIATSTSISYLIEVISRVSGDVYYNCIYTTADIDLSRIFNGVSLTLTDVHDGTGRTIGATVYASALYCRYLLDSDRYYTDSHGVMETYELDSSDIAGANPNYRYAIGFTPNLVTISRNMSSDATEYGVNEDGKYYKPPYSLAGIMYHPICQNYWGSNFSLWFAFSELDFKLEQRGRSSAMVRAYPIHSVLQVLLDQTGGNYTHADSTGYSEFLYGEDTEWKTSYWRLMITPKSNLLVGEGASPAKKGTLSLKAVLDLLKNLYKLYWFIEDGKLRIEHVNWFENGGSYDGSPTQSVDLTELYNVRNKKAYSFATNKYSYDKEAMPSVYEFSWQDECTTPFEGQDLKIISPYVDDGKTESISFANFTSDIDYILANPSDINKDGFALFGACVPSADVINESATIYRQSLTATSGNDSAMVALCDVLSGTGYTVTFEVTCSSVSGSFYVIFADKDGGIVGSSDALTGTTSFSVEIPTGARYYYLNTTGSVTAKVTSTVEGIYGLPIVAIAVGTANITLQNAYCSMYAVYGSTLNYVWLYDMPAMSIEVNGENETSMSISKNKIQKDVNIPCPTADLDPFGLVGTGLGDGQIEKMSVNLSSRNAKTTLRYAAE